MKSIQFSVNEVTLLYLETNANLKSNVLKMAIAGTLAGLLSSFVVEGHAVRLPEVPSRAARSSIYCKLQVRSR